MNILKLRRSSALRCLAAMTLFCAEVRAVTINGSGITITSSSNGGIQVFDSSGTQRMLFDGLRFSAGSDSVAAYSGTASLTNGNQTMRVLYNVTGDSTDSIAVTGQFTPSDHGLYVRFDITGPPTPTAAWLRRRSVPDNVSRKNVKTGLWTRPAAGVTPYETSDFTGFEYAFSDRKGLLKTPGAEYSDSWSSAISLTLISAGHWRAESWFAFVPETVRTNAAAAAAAPRALGLDIWTNKTYNLWDSSSSPLSLYAQAYNNSSASKTLTLSWWARDFSGNIVAQDDAQLSVGARAPWNRTISIPAISRGILFVEVKVTDGTASVFARTNLAVLPPFTFQSAPGSLFGLSTVFRLPDNASELALLQRMGVRSLRRERYSAAEAAGAGIVQFAHSNNTGWISGPVPQSWSDAQLNAAEDITAPFWEVSNEMNLTSGTAATYVNNFLIPAKNRATAIAPTVKIMLGGLAGMDTSFTDALYNAGGWSYLNAFAIHPGRGNFMADLGGDGWTFLGAIRKAKAKLTEYGSKPLYITEAYACTQPNSTWFDSIRHAAENVVLSYALAKAEGVKVMHWYQLNDTSPLDVGGVDPADKEYHFGLLNRDLSPKPSLLGYCTIAEALDLAEFEREMTFEDTKLRGLMFSSPYGSVSVLWDRTDGYVLDNQASTSEPWIDDWTTQKTVTLKTEGTSLGLPDPTYLQPFDNGSSEVNVSSKPGWTVYIASTGAATTSPKIQAGGVIYSSPGANNGFVFTGTDTGTIALETGTDISLDTIASSNIARVRLLLRLSNGQWYASNTEWTPATAATWADAHDPENGIEYRRSIQFTRTASEWSSFNLTPGSPMGVGATLTSNLPSGTITSIGWYVRNTHSSWGVTARFDNIDLPSVNVCDAIGRTVKIRSKNKRATLSLTGAPSIVYGLDPNEGNVTVMDTDDSGVTKSGTWTSSSASAPFLGDGYLHDGNAGKGSKYVQYVPNLSVSGTYRVEALWNPNSNRSSAVPYTITHAGGTATVTKDQRTGGVWTELGTYTFNQGTGGKVKISNTGTSGYVIADGIRFIQQ